MDQQEHMIIRNTLIYFIYINEFQNVLNLLLYQKEFDNLANLLLYVTLFIYVLYKRIIINNKISI